ncbi:MAG: hypothetical protein PHV34_13145 [Verrucomicrobiae bacterium]|nr:hypothetical protein [Verrucomicrobiae bacterium]
MKKINFPNCAFFYFSFIICLTSSQYAGEKPSTHTQNEEAVDQMRIKTPEIAGLLKKSLARMREIDKEVKALARENWLKREKTNPKLMVIISNANGEFAILNIRLFSENGPIEMADKAVFKDSACRDEIKNKRYQIHFDKTGKVLSLTIGAIDAWLEFYPSGRLNVFQVLQGKEIISDLRINDDDTIISEKYSPKNNTR